MIRLKENKSYRYCGHAKYLATYDYAAGKNNKYTLLILTAFEPVTIGREIDLKLVGELIAEYEGVFSEKVPYFGDPSEVDLAIGYVSARRRNK